MKLNLDLNKPLAPQFAAIPVGETFLDISDNDLGGLTGAGLAAVFKEIPITITALCLGDNALWRLGAELALCFPEIPANVTSLSLSSIGLNFMPADSIYRVLTSLPCTVTSLDLSSNGLGVNQVYRFDLVTVMRSLSPALKSLNLSNNIFCNMSNLDEVLVAIPSGVTSLDLSRNIFKLKSITALSRIFAAIPANVNSVDLSYCGFGDKNTAKLIKAFEAIPPTVTTINLNGNNFNFKSKTRDELIAIINSIPSTVSEIVCDGLLAEILQECRMRAYKKIEEKVFPVLASEVMKFFDKNVCFWAGIRR